MASKASSKKTPPTLTVSSPGLPPQPQVNITHGNSRISAVLPTGESVDIMLYGATILSWKDTAGNEKLWLSEGAKLDGSKAVRGGVPLVFPVFGTDASHTETSKLPQHGFARTTRWEFLGKSTSESSAVSSTDGGDNSVKLDFGLSHSNLSAEARAAWPYDFGLIYSVTLSRDGLATSIVVRNESEGESGKGFEFQTLMHTYLRVNDIADVSVEGLESSPYIDKVAVKTTTSPAEKLSITSKTDRVYTPAGGPSKPVVVSEAGKKKFSIVRDNLNEVVVWNPWKDGAEEIGDFTPKSGFKNMICVEAGAVKGWQKLEAGETWEGGQVINC
ncbi:putative glucose-6-phosphate 1-epimerase [Coleophoma crateriformis]|uniref:Glucose-6-phosphate 1-epimerase n=1 Tax=Coleophoma crateriformis TaxID=565419 RepID=A0A3D8R7F6_9HELO|nr:putative glucose-6-phosphate 1-epimerase [Coleophoma crateriformis]